MASPSEIRDELLRELRSARDQLMSAEWLSMIREAPKKQKQSAADNLMKIQLALLDLENEALATFRDDLVANEADLVDSTQGLKKALDRLESTSRVLKAVTDFLGVVARVVTLF
jgi:hypothetical protein